MLADPLSARPIRQRLALAGGFAAVYFLSAQLSLALKVPAEGVASIWPASGVALGVAPLAGPRGRPMVYAIIFATNLLANLAGGIPWAISPLFAVANVAEAAVAASLLGRGCKTRFDLCSLRQVMELFAYGAILSTLASALLGALGAHLAFGSEYVHTLVTWWIANSIGVLVLTPLILTWLTPGRERLIDWSARRVVEIGCAVSMLLITAAMVFNGFPGLHNLFVFPGTHMYLTFPWLLWCAARGGPPLGATAMLLLAVVSVASCLVGPGPFGPGYTMLQRIHSVQAFLGVAALTTLVTAAIMAELRRAERAAREQEQRLRQAIAGSNVSLWEWNLQTDEVVFLRHWAEMCGYPPEAIEDHHVMWAKYVHPDEQAWLRRTIDEHLAGRTPRWETEHRRRALDGTWRWLLDRGQVIARDAAGRALRAVGLQVDITEKKCAEELLRASEARSGALVDALPDILFRLGADDRLLEVHTPRPGDLGTPTEQLIGARYDELLPPDVSQAVACHLALVRSEHKLQSFEYSLPTQAGELRSYEARIAPTEGDEVLVLVRDITVQRRALEELRHQEERLAHVTRLSTLGELVAGISHEINQPLTAISNFATACRSSLASPGSLASQRISQWTEQIAEQAKRAGQIIRRMRDFARDNQPKRSPIDLNGLVRESADLLEPERRRLGVDLALELVDGAPAPLADRVQLQQVLVNVLRNAFEAVADAPTGQRCVCVRTALVESAVQVSVEDAGCGLPANEEGSSTQDVFKPFYSTKPQGLGLGLAISRTIIQAHGGRLWATPNEERGATFSFVVPLGEGDASA